MEGLSLAAWIAFVFQDEGETGLRELLDMVAPDQESLLQAAQELEETSLPGLAAIVAQAVLNPEECPFDLGSRLN